MRAIDIKCKTKYHFSRKTATGPETGKGEVFEKVKKPNGWYIFLNPDDSDKTPLELRPVNILRSVGPRKA